MSWRNLVFRPIDWTFALAVFCGLVVVSPFLLATWFLFVFMQWLKKKTNTIETRSGFWRRL